MIHLFTRELHRLADGIEREFFRIERESRFLSSLMNGLIAGTAVGIVSWLSVTLEEGDLLLFACLGSSAASVVFAPISRANSLRSIIFAYMICCGVCLGLSAAQPVLPLTMHDWPSLHCFVAVLVSIFLMRLCDAMHPAAVGSAMAFIIYERDMRSLVLLMLAMIGMLTIVKVLAYVYLEPLTFRTFGREFSRDYYGHEMTVTVVNRRTERRLDERDLSVTIDAAATTQQSDHEAARQDLQGS